jgi:hypothetical protein
MAQSFGERITPYLTIWTEPRATIRRIVEIDPERNVILLAAIAPGLALLEREWVRAMQEPVSAVWPIRVVVEVIFFALAGVVALYISGLLLNWAAQALGGTGTALETRTAIAWAKIPSITASIAGIVALLSGAINPPEIGINGLPKMTPPTFEFGGVHFVFGVWSFIVLLKCVGEVQHISVWRALIAEVIVLVATVSVLVGLILLVMALAHPAHH